MSQYRDLHQCKTVKNPVSKKVQELIDREKKSYTNPICEFCETPYNESKTEDCFRCKCMREGRHLPNIQTLREYYKERNIPLSGKGMTERD